jgi:UDP-N-acetyl-D-galactosamine dehydrogenase
MKNFRPDIKNIHIGIIGLGYVGLPLAVEFAKYFPVVGFDIDTSRINQLSKGFDRTLEVSQEQLSVLTKLKFTLNSKNLEECNFYIITVPTPVDNHKQPNLLPLFSASETVGKVLKGGDIVVYESTVYPGATEDDCVPVLEKVSGFKLNIDFYVGYSPERINPGDKTRGVKDIQKITSGSTRESAKFIDEVYKKIITAGTYLADSIRVAEAAKVVENTQRDLNIALMNELAIIFNRLGIDTQSVLDAAATKWNFLSFKPGLVGGHCIGVDPYYLTHKGQAIGCYPEIILAGRRLNDGMGAYVSSQLLREMARYGIAAKKSKILIMGFSFKENCPDIRNTRVIDIIRELVDCGCAVEIYDPRIDSTEVQRDYQIELIDAPEIGVYDAIILAVPHQEFIEKGIGGIRAYGKDKAIFYDIKSVFPKQDQSHLRL